MCWVLLIPLLPHAKNWIFLGSVTQEAFCLAFSTPQSWRVTLPFSYQDLGYQVIPLIPPHDSYKYICSSEFCPSKPLARPDVSIIQGFSTQPRAPTANPLSSSSAQGFYVIIVPLGLNTQKIIQSP